MMTHCSLGRLVVWIPYFLWLDGIIPALYPTVVSCLGGKIGEIGHLLSLHTSFPKSQ